MPGQDCSAVIIQLYYYNRTTIARPFRLHTYVALQFDLTRFVLYVLYARESKFDEKHNTFAVFNVNYATSGGVFSIIKSYMYGLFSLDFSNRLPGKSPEPLQAVSSSCYITIRVTGTHSGLLIIKFKPHNMYTRVQWVQYS